MPRKSAGPSPGKSCWNRRTRCRNADRPALHRLSLHAPQRISSSAGGSLTIVNRMSEAAAASRGVFASFAPAATSSEARDAVRFHTVTEWPALSRFRLIGLPIRPSPIKPIFREGDAVLTKCLLTPTLRWSVNHTQNMRLNCSRFGEACGYSRRVTREAAQTVFGRCGSARRDAAEDEYKPGPALAAEACETSGSEGVTLGAAGGSGVSSASSIR